MATIEDLKEEFLSRPLTERRLVQFAEVDNYDEELSGGKLVFWVSIATLMSPILIPGMVKDHKRDKIGLHKIDKKWSSILNLPPGHPSETEAYVCHPVDETTFLPLKDYHRWAFEHKFAELIRLLQSLGAKRIEVSHEEGWSKEFAGSIDLDLFLRAGHGKVDSSLTSQSDMLFRADYEGHGNPRLPADLAWYDHEPAWQAIAEGRLNHDLEEFSLQLKYTDDFGINANLAAKVKKFGLSAGGSFTRHKKTIWKIRGAFKKRLFDRYFSFG
jgi:hypothetical protein